MKIIVYDPLGSEGQAMYDYTLCEELEKLNNKVIFVSCPEFKNNYTYSEPKFTLQLVLKGHRNKKNNKIIKILSYAFSNFKFIFLVIREKPDLVHYQFLYFPIIDYFVLRLLRRRCTIIFTAHDIRVTTGFKVLSILRPQCFRLFHGIWVHSTLSQKLLADYIFVNNQKIAVIEHGNYLPFLKKFIYRSKQESRKVLKLPERKFIILFLGSILEYKGLDVLINAFSIAYKKDIEVHLVIAGSTRDKSFDKYNNIIIKNELLNGVSLIIKFLNDDEIFNLLSASDIIALPYRECYTPGVAHLSMTFGLPVIASDVGALSSVISDNETGILVDSFDESIWATKILMCKKSVDDLKIISENARKRMLQFHDWKRIAEQAVSFYKLVIDQKHSNNLKLIDKY